MKGDYYRYLAEVHVESDREGKAIFDTADEYNIMYNAHTFYRPQICIPQPGSPALYVLQAT